MEIDMMHPCNIFFDMDGVLVVYEEADYVPKAPGAPKPYLGIPHYFAHLKPDEKAIRMFQFCAESGLHLDPPRYPTVLSSAFGEEPYFTETVADKRAWIREHIGANAKLLALFAKTGTQDAMDKVATAELEFGRPLCVTDILIDDLNANLRSWKSAGGTAVKYLNGINSRTDEFPCLTTDEAGAAGALDMLMQLDSILKQACDR